MSLSIDFPARRVRVSVSDLAGVGRGRAIGLGGRSLTRLWMGQELHRQVQDELRAEEEGFRAEVTLSHEFHCDDWVLEIFGRADGILFEKGFPRRVDEIKTLHFAVDLNGLYVEERLEPFTRQLGIYAWLLYQEFDTMVEARLLLVDIVGRGRRIKEFKWNAEVVEADLRRFLHRVRSAETRRIERLRVLEEAARSIPFPHAQARDIQTEIGREVETSLDAGEPLLLQAPTGSGKTAAVLHPALRWAMARGKTLFFLTAKTLQQRLAVQTIENMQGEGAFRSLQLRAKSKMCANEEMICHEEYCAWAREYGIKLLHSRLLEELKEGAFHQDPDQIYEQAFNCELCPFEVSLDLLEDSGVVVCDYNYVFDPSIGLQALLGERGLQDTVLIIDEAHNLVQRSREYYSPEITVKEIEHALVFQRGREHSVFGKLRKVCEALKSAILKICSVSLNKQGEAPAEFDPSFFADLRMDFDGAMLEYFMYKKERGLFSAQDPIVELFLALVRFQRVLALGGSEFVHLARRTRAEGESLRIFCRDASRFTGEILSQCGGAVAMSATLEPFEFYRDLLGIPGAREKSFESPFPRENRLILNIPEIDTTWKRRARFHDAVAAWILRLAPREGNALILFPSYAYLNDVAQRLLPLLGEFRKTEDSAPEWKITIQEAGLKDSVQDELLQVLKSPEPHLVLAVLGGIFAEGIDYPGSMLSEVIIVSPALPQFNTEQELLKQFLEERYGHGFSYAYLIPGMTRVIQAAGRLIRSEEDRGVIVLIGRRFQHSRHARLFPPDWISGDPATLLDEDPEFAVRRFFEDP